MGKFKVGDKVVVTNDEEIFPLIRKGEVCKIVKIFEGGEYDTCPHAEVKSLSPSCGYGEGYVGLENLAHFKKGKKGNLKNPRNHYIVEGSTGEYADYVTWIAGDLSFNSLAAARKYLKQLNAASDKTARLKLDKNHREDYTGTDYEIKKLKVGG